MISQQFLAAFLTEQDHPCPQCGYNLRNLQGNRCPECGEELVLRVNLAEQKQKLLTAGAGLNGLLIIYCLIIMMTRTWYGENRVFVICGAGLVIETFAMFFWLRAWRSIRRLSTPTRFWLAAACWVLTLIDLLIFSFTVK